MNEDNDIFSQLIHAGPNTPPEAKDIVTWFPFIAMSAFYASQDRPTVVE